MKHRIVVSGDIVLSVEAPDADIARDLIENYLNGEPEATFDQVKSKVEDKDSLHTISQVNNYVVETVETYDY